MSNIKEFIINRVIQHLKERDKLFKKYEQFYEQHACYLCDQRQNFKIAFSKDDICNFCHKPVCTLHTKKKSNLLRHHISGLEILVPCCTNCFVGIKETN